VSTVDTGEKRVQFLQSLQRGETGRRDRGGMLALGKRHTIMNATIQTAIRHALTGLAAVGGFLASRGWIDAAAATDVNSAGAMLADALSAILAALAARLMIFLIGKVTSSGKAKVYGMPFVLGVLAAGLLAASLPSCTPAQRETLSGIPVRACFTDKDGNRVCYSSKSGLEAEVDRRSGK
jgi:hypothetical protein